MLFPTLLTQTALMATVLAAGLPPTNSTSRHDSNAQALQNADSTEAQWTDSSVPVPGPIPATWDEPEKKDDRRPKSFAELAMGINSAKKVAAIWREKAKNYNKNNKRDGEKYDGEYNITAAGKWWTTGGTPEPTHYPGGYPSVHIPSGKAHVAAISSWEAYESSIVESVAAHYDSVVESASAHHESVVASASAHRQSVVESASAHHATVVESASAHHASAVGHLASASAHLASASAHHGAVLDLHSAAPNVHTVASASVTEHVVIIKATPTPTPTSSSTKEAKSEVGQKDSTSEEAATPTPKMVQVNAGVESGAVVETAMIAGAAALAIAAGIF